jgi:probable HAF family extracellular repeat protein
MTDLGTLPGGETSAASAVNERGEVVGTADTATGNHAFRWHRARPGGLDDLGAPAGDRSFAVDVNERGDVLGEYWGARQRVVVWDDGRSTPPGTTAPEWDDASATALNDNGLIAGESVGGEYERATVWLTRRARQG